MKKKRLMSFFMCLIILLTSQPFIIFGQNIKASQEKSEDLYQDGEEPEEPEIEPELEIAEINHVFNGEVEKQGEYIVYDISDIDSSGKFSEIINGLKNEEEKNYQIQEIINKEKTRYALKHVVIVLEDDKEILLSKEDLSLTFKELLEKEDQVENLEKILLEKVGENEEEGEKVSIILSDIAKINFDYELFGYEKTFKFNIFGQDIYHNDISKISSQNKEISFIKEEDLETCDLTISRSGDRYNFSVIGKTRSGEKVEARGSTSWQASSYYSSSKLYYRIKSDEEEDFEEIVLNGDEKIIKDLPLENYYEFKVDLEPKVENYYGQIAFLNKYNGQNIYKYFKLDQENLYLDSKDSEGVTEDAVDISDLVSIDFENREEDKQEVEFRYNDKVRYDLIEGKSLNDLIKLVIDKDYQLDGKNELDFLVSYKSRRINIYFDYNRDSFEIVHKGQDGEEKRKDISLMPETEYLYIKPQGEGEILDLEMDEDGYYKIKLEGKKELVINYPGEAPEIEVLDYRIQNIRIDRAGKESNLNSPRQFTGYKGTKFSVQPIVQHQHEEGEDIQIGEYRFADHYDKFISLDDKLSLLGYGSSLENLNKNVTEEVEGNTVKFRFIDKSSVLYKIIHRTGFGKNYKEGTDYNLSLEGEGINKVNIAESKYYVVPKGTKITVRPLSLDGNLERYKLIKSEKVGEDTGQALIKEISGKGKRTQKFLADEYSLNLAEDTEFIFSYALGYEDGEVKENLNFNYNAEVYSDDEATNLVKSKEIPLSYPIFIEDHEAILPVKRIYTCHSLRNIKYNFPKDKLNYIKFYDQDGNVLAEDQDSLSGDLASLGINDVNTVKHIGLGIKKSKEDEIEKDYFPKLRSKIEARQAESFVSLIYKRGKDEDCKPSSFEKYKAKIYLRYKEDGEYVIKNHYTIEAIEGSIVEIERLGNSIVSEEDSSIIYRYKEYEKGEDNTGISDKDGRHISRLYIDQWGHPITGKEAELSSEHNIKYIELNKDEEFYINYERQEREKPEVEIFEENNYFTKKFYYIPFNYFEKELEEDIWDKEAFNENSWTCQTDIMVPKYKESYEEKYNNILREIDNYYKNYSNKTKEHLLNFYKIRDISDKNLIGYDEGFDTYEYKQYLYGLLNEDIDEEEKDLIRKEIDTVVEFKQYKLPDHLKENGIPVEYINYGDEVFDSHESNIKVQWKKPSVDRKPISNREHQNYKSKSYEDLASKEKVTESVFKTNRYSDVPICISKVKSKDINEDISLDFIKNPKNEDISKVKEAECTIQKGQEKNNEIPIIYLERENLCKEERRQSIPSPGEDKTIDLTIKYYIIDKDSIETGPIVEKKEFYSYTYKNLPKYLKGSKIGWKITDFEKQGFKYYEDGEYELSNSTKWSKPLEENRDNLIKFYYYRPDGGEELPNLDLSNIYVHGLDYDQQDKNLYKYSFTDLLLGSEVEIYPYNLEAQGYYLVNEDGDLIVDYEEEIKQVKAEKEDQLYKYYYKKIEKPEDLVEYTVHYLDSQGDEIASWDSYRFTVDDKLIDIKKEAKNISGYEPRIDQKLFEVEKGKIKIKDLDGYEIKQKENLSILEKNGEKILTLDNRGENPRIAFYYDKIQEETPPIPPIWPSNRVFTFDANGGKINNKDKEVLIITSGAKVKAREDVKRKGYKFLGWTRDKDGNKFFDFNTIINKDMTVYAKWEKDKVESGKLNKRDHIEYIQGYVDGSVRPNANISKQEVAAAFYRLLDKDYKDTIYITSNKFKDVPENLWSNRHISTLANGDILKGYPDGNFRPRNHISRAELAVIVSRFIGFKEADHNFDDIRGHWAEEEIASAIAQGLFIGHEDGNFRPSDKLTRAEFVTVVNRLLERGVDRDRILDGIKTFTDLKEDKWYYTDFVEATNGHIYDLEHFQETGKEIWLELKDFNQDDMFSIK